MSTPPATVLPEEHAALCCNEVHLVGVVRRPPVERALPSGDSVVSWSLRIPRPEGRTVGPRGTGDSLDISAWTAPLRKKALTLASGDLVEVHGALRRQVRGSAGAVSSRHEVEVSTVRRVARAPRP